MYTRDEIEEIYKLTKENNKILRSMRRSARIHALFKLIFWVAILGLPVWAYFNYIQPVLGDVINTLETVQNAGEKLQQINNNPVPIDPNLLNKILPLIENR